MRRATTPEGWTRDGDDWLWRPARSTDSQRIAASETPHRMFTGSEAPAERGRTYCCEPEEADYLDRRPPGARS